MFATLVTRLRASRFLRREDGSIAVEAMIILPMVFWTYLSLFSIFDAFRQYSVNQKAAYTIGDVISRETTPINDTYLTGTRELFSYLTRTATADTAIRVSSLVYDANHDKYKADWSHARGGQAALTNDDVRNWHDRLPVMPHGERVVVVQTWAQYQPPFNTGLEQREIRNFVFTRPRYAPRVCWDVCN